jgi:chitodextrinase
MTLAGLAALLVALPVPNAAAGADKASPSIPQNLRVLSAAQTSVDLVWDASTDDVEVEGYKVWFGQPTPKKPLDHEPSVKTHEAQFTATQLACGQSYEVEVRAYDRANNLSEGLKSVASTSPCVDNQPPSAPTGLKQTAASATSATLAWSPSTDDVAVAGYALGRAGIELGTTSETSYSFSGLPCGKTSAVAVRAYDVARNYSAWVDYYVTTGACGDVSPPSAPTGLVQTNKTASGMSIAWTPSSDNVGVAGYEIFRDGVLAGSTSGVSYSFSGLSCGTSYTAGVVGIDGAGNRSARTNATMSTAPCVAPPPPTTDTQPPTTPTSLTLVAAQPTSVTLTWSPSTDNVGVTGYGTFQDGAPVQVVTGHTFVYQGLSCGTSHQLGVQAYDAKGNHSGIASVTASTTPCSDTSPPTTPKNPVLLDSTSSSVTILWSASTDNVGVAGYGAYVGGQLAGSTVGQTYTFTGLACNTSFVLGIDAYDAVGNRSPTVNTALATTSCDDIQPPTTPSQLTVSNATQTGLTLNWTASSDNGGVAGYDVFVNGVKTATASATGYTLSNLTCATTYTLGVQAFDRAGNRSSRSTVSSSTLACSAPPPPPGGSGNVVLSPAGNDSTCVRGDSTRPCRTFQRSYDIAQPGDVVSVQAGTYAANDSARDAVTIFGPERSSASPITFTCAGGSVSHSSQWFRIKAFHVRLSGSCFKLHGLMLGEGGDTGVTTQDVSVDGAHLDGLEIVGARQVTIRNVEIGPNVYCYAQGRTGTGFNGGPITPAMWCDPNGPAWEAFYASTGSDQMQFQTFFHSNSGGVTPTVVMEGSYAHDFQTKDVYNLHTGCGLVWTRPGEPAGSIVFRGNRFENCAVQGIQFTQADGITITGNWFGHPIEPLSNGLGDDVEAGREQREISLATESGWSPKNYLISFNSFDHGISLDNTQLRPAYSNVVVRRNLLGQNTYCPEGIVFEANIFAGRACAPDQLTAPFGYILKDERLVVVKEEAKTITEIFKAAVAEKEPAAIAKELRKARKGKWSARSVRKIVESDFYLGSKVGPKGAHPAIVSRGIWKRAQREIQR